MSAEQRLQPAALAGERSLADGREVDGDLFELRSYCGPDRAWAVNREAHARLLDIQIAGLVVSRAALDGCPPHDLARFALQLGEALSRDIGEHLRRYAERLAAAKERYTFL